MISEIDKETKLKKALGMESIYAFQKLFQKLP